MCGIVGYVGEKDCGILLLEGLRKLEYRGYDSAGLAVFCQERIVMRRAEGKLRNLEAAFYREPMQGTVGIGHTRWATHGRPTERNAHPHRSGSVVVVHNGIIENHLKLKEELQSRGRVFTSDTDTEIIAHLVEEALVQGVRRGTGHPLHCAVRAALERLHGSYGVAVLCEEYPDVIVGARNASPLVLGVGEGEQFLASDIPAILGHTRDFMFLEDGDTALLTREGTKILDFEGTEVARDVKRITWDPIAAEKQGYKHFMLKEIHEQPERIVETLRGRIHVARGDVDFGCSWLDDAFVEQVDHIQVVACGTSYNAGLIGRYWVESLARIHTSVDLGSEFRYANPVVGPRTLTIAISQSGETADTLAALRLAKEQGSKVLAICNVMESTIARESDCTLYTHAGPEIGVASTKAYTTQLSALYMLGVWLGRHRGLVPPAKAQELLEDLRRVPRIVENLIEDQGVYRALARKFSHARSFLYLGRGINWPVALEGALKLKEISYIHAEGYAFGEMKHGPIALIDDEMPIVAIVTQCATYEKAFSNLEEVRARGGRIIAVATEGDENIASYADTVLFVPDVPEALQPIINAIPLQLLAYHLADFKGTDVDQPRNLAKSVTVE